MRLPSTMVALFVMLLVAPAWAADDVDAVSAELQRGGDLASGEVARFEQQLRTRLGGEQVCAGDEACQQQLRAQVRATHRVGKQTGRIESAEDAAAVASAVMMMAGNGGDVEEAGELVQQQLKHQWKAEQVGENAKQMKQLRHRWRHQTMKMVGACAGDGSCTPEEAQVAVRTMKSASQRADLDARRVAREVRAAVAEHAQLRQKAGENLQKRLQKRLRLKGEGGTESTVTSGEQQRHRYRNQAAGEGRRGGSYGKDSSGRPRGR